MNRITMKKGSDRIVIFDKTTGFVDLFDFNSNMNKKSVIPEVYALSNRSVFRYLSN